MLLTRLQPERHVVPFLAGFSVALLLTSLRMLNSSSGTDESVGSGLLPGGAPSSTVGAAKTLNPRNLVPRKKVLAVIGVQTGFTVDRSNPKYDYGLRRRALRASWFPASPEELTNLEDARGLVLRFVIGWSPDESAEREISEESARHGGFMRLPLQEGYGSLTNKTLTFFRLVTQLYDAEYIIKADDDVYLRIDRVPAAIVQWKDAKADYVGCMKNGPVFTSHLYRWYEPQHTLLGNTYFTHCWGTIYALSGRAASMLCSLDPATLRYFANEDVTVGSWMLGLKVQHFDDRRLCSPECNEASIAIYDYPKCAGLCDPANSLERLHASSACHAQATFPDGTLLMLPAGYEFLPLDHD